MLGVFDNVPRKANKRAFFLCFFLAIMGTYLEKYGMSVADAVQIAHKIIENEDIREENFDFLLYLCDFLGKEDKV